MRTKQAIPSIFTLGNIACGFMAIVSGSLIVGSIFLLIGIFLDTFDGYFARKLNAESALGKELDSLADVISFGIAPAYLYHLLAPSDHWVFYFAPILFLIGAALRLAKFNTLPKLNYFIGLPTPFATLFLLGLFIGIEYDKTLFISTLSNPFIYYSIPFFLMVLMLSNLKMFSLKSLDNGLAENKLPFLTIAIFALLLFVDFRIACSSIVVIYILLSLLKRNSIQQQHSSSQE